MVGGSNRWLIEAEVGLASVTSAGCGWMWEWGGEQAMDELTENPPRVFYFERDISTWGYPLADYAPEMIDYIDQNYTPLFAYGLNNLYVRKDIYMEAIALIDPSVIYATNAKAVGITCGQNQRIEQTFSVQEDCTIDSVGLMVAAYERINYCTLNIELMEDETEKPIWIGSKDCKSLEDNALNEISVGHVDLSAGKKYKLSIESPDAKENQVVSLYRSDLRSTEETFCTINGIIQDYNLTLEIHKADPAVIFCADAFELGEPLYPGHTLTQTFYVDKDCTVASLGVIAGTYERINKCNLCFNLSDRETGESIWQGSSSCKTMRDNKENLIDMDSVDLLAGHSYVLSFFSPDATDESVIAICHSGPNATKKAFASIDGVPQIYNLAINIYT